MEEKYNEKVLNSDGVIVAWKSGDNSTFYSSFSGIGRLGLSDKIFSVVMDLHTHTLGKRTFGFTYRYSLDVETTLFPFV